MNTPLRRRTVVLGMGAGSAALLAAGCTRPAARSLPPVQWVGASHARGHRLRGQRLSGSDALPPPAVQHRAAALVLGGGVAGLAAARGLLRRGVQDVHLLELEDQPGGNSRGHQLAGMACPLGAHYLPLPGPQAREVAEWLHELGLLKQVLGRTVADERHLCHSPQERLFFDGTWVDGLVPPVEPGSASARQMQAFAQAVVQVRREGARSGPGGAPAFAQPSHRSAWGPLHAALDAQTFAQWLDARGLDDSHLRWYLSYCCRDDYGATPAEVSAWAGLHYFASRHGFHAPGNDASSENRDAVFTWPEGNGWLTQRLAAPLGERLHGGRTVLRVSEGRHEVQVLAWDEARQRVESWTAPLVVLALPLFIAARIVQNPTPALREAAARLHHAPWLVANLHIDAPLLGRPGAPASWDNVVYGGGLGYVDAMHQSLQPVPGATVLTAYHALPRGERAALLAADPAPWAERVLAELRVVHPDIDRRVQRIHLMRWGHAMAIPAPGVQRHPALLALRAARGRLRFAHADLAGYSVFEEAFMAGSEAALG